MRRVIPAIGNVTLNGGTLSQSSTEGTPANFDGYQFRGTITVTGTSASTISSPNGRTNHLGTNTNFNVADVTGDANADLVVSAILRDQSNDFAHAAGSFTKNGAGTMALTAVNAYTGPTTVAGGTLALVTSATNNNISSSPTITVNSGATLDVSQVTAGGGFMIAAADAGEQRNGRRAW